MSTTLDLPMETVAAATPAPASIPAQADPPDDTVTLLVGGVALRGWQSIRVTRGCERVPADFAFAMTERFPGAADAVVEPFQPCEVRFGEDLVITGYVDRYAPAFSIQSHKVAVSGRSKSQDLVDCAAVFAGNQLMAHSVLALAQQLAQAYGIDVYSLGDPGPIIPQFSAMQGETSWDIIERVTRFAGLLAYDQPDGRVVLARVGSERHASGFVEGVNVEEASVSFSADQRFSEYRVLLSSTESLGDLAGASGGAANYNRRASELDERTPRFRLHVIIGEQTQADPTLSARRAAWEKARRFGRSQAVTVLVDGWRDSAGRLWEPNTIAQVRLPSLKLESEGWVISEVTYLLDSSGTHAQVTLMPPEAFALAPTVLAPFDWQVKDDPGLRAFLDGAGNSAP